MKRQRRCDAASAVFYLIVAVLLGVASFTSVAMIHDVWVAKDYWLAWFSAFAMLGSVVFVIQFSIAFAAAMDCGTEIE